MPRLPIKGEYPKTWGDVAKLVKDEAGWKCVRCSHVHDAPAGRCLTVHHFTGDKSNCERWNLMPLCQKCHLSIQGRVNPEISLLFEPAVWSMPYIAGFYESGRGIPCPSYDLAAWIERHGHWPAWAPQPR